MNIALPLNKRTVLGGQYLLVGATGALALESTLLAVALITVGVYLLFAPVVA
ncbi:hypothetical protein [Halorussus lipolyticus]|uniref:hypothetical protein n=1 Tax=Halorussus lipolyticus TaxID=3034024 RepID=UPI0023E8A9D4|nr:hypothetical protein [Halorussus sp. DT80]